MPKAPEETGTKRDKKGKFVKGQSGNPEGRPEGSGVSITTEIKRRLELIPKGEKATNLQLLLDVILEEAIKKKDKTMITKIWNYIDGMPAQKLIGDPDNPVTIRFHDSLKTNDR